MNSDNENNKLNNNKYKQETINIESKIQETFELSILYDFYGELLTDKNKEVFTQYIFNDLSLSEISEQMGITRQGIHDIIKRSSKKLYEYEDSLHLVDKFKTIEKKVNRIKELIEELKIIETKNESSSIEILKEMNDLTDDILQSL